MLGRFSYEQYQTISWTHHSIFPFPFIGREKSCHCGKYTRDIRAFATWLENRPITKEAAAERKHLLAAQGYALVTIIAMLSALNGLFGFLGLQDCRVKFLKVQRQLYQEADWELSRTEYERLLVDTKNDSRKRLALLMETICATSI